MLLENLTAANTMLHSEAWCWQQKEGTVDTRYYFSTLVVPVGLCSLTDQFSTCFFILSAGMSSFQSGSQEAFHPLTQSQVVNKRQTVQAESLFQLQPGKYGTDNLSVFEQTK